MTEKTTSKQSTEPEDKATKSPGKTRTESKKPSSKQIEKLEKKIAELEEALAEAVRDKDDAEDRMKRVVAEYENAKKRVEREAERSLVYARDRLLQGLFPLVDNMRRAARFEDSHQDDDSHQQGQRMIFDQMNQYLKDTAGVEAFEPLGEPFDPEQHEAMAMRAEEGQDSGMVVEVFECGYRSGDRILRHAKVVVSE